MTLSPLGSGSDFSSAPSFASACACGTERAFLFRIVLAVERAISAERNHAEREQFSRFFTALFINRGTEAHGKFVDFKAERFAGEIVPEFVNGYHGEKNRHRRQHAARIL